MRSGSGDVWPMQPGGGLFLICIGAGLIYGALLQGRAVVHGLEFGFLAGAVAIVMTAILAKGRFGRPTASHRLVVLAAIGLELIAFAVLGRSGFFAGGMSAMTWAVILSVINLHFVIMRWSHGPWIFWLAVASQCWVVLAYLAMAPESVLVTGDGLLKIAFGIVMATPLAAMMRRSSQG